MRLVALLIAVAGPPAAAWAAGEAKASPPPLSVVEVSGVSDERGEHVWLQLIGIDDRGGAVGTANVWSPAQPSFLDYPLAFRFDPETRRSTAVDPWKTGYSTAYAVNGNGTILGRAWTGRGIRHRLFGFTDGAGSDRLRKGQRKWMVWPRHLLVNARDQSTVATVRPSGRQAVLVYDQSLGWLDRSDGLRLPDGIEAFALNGAGDFIVEASRGDRRFDGVYGSFGGRPLVRVSPRGHQSSLGALGEDGRVVGTYRSPPRYVFQAPGPRRGFLFTPGKGRVEIEPPGTLQVDPRWVSSSGTIGGTARIRSAMDAVFTYREGAGYELTDLRLALKELDRRLELRNAEVVDMNDRGAFIGQIRVQRGGRSRRCLERNRLPFLLDPELGLVDIQAVVDEAGLDLGVGAVLDLNDRGHILAQACRADRSRTAVLLTPG